ncbi:Sporulation kinase E [Planctomycetes bacterium Pan216]|uniref:histidine kinase n=1 Tax=Kolteria novifilia TaxID=2527975 RepID=A0A518B6D7_9BACT|nr:Sporulation kinase E [Planctomycetes bacterium Pan216]
MSGSQLDVADEKHRWLLEQYTEVASLAGGLAHEIKNPLSTLTLNLQLLTEDFADPENQRERRALQKIETLQKECHRLEEILDAFLRFARISELNPAPADLNKIVREVIEFQSAHADACGIVLRDDLHASLPDVRLDADLIKQAVLNLVLNALHVMSEGGELILKTRFDDRFVYLDVIDTGPGMSQEVISRIFKPFYSTRRGGNGLGLPTTKKIVEGHHGRLLVESEPGKGTAFTIELPIPTS